MTATEAMKILQTDSPAPISKMFNVSSRSLKLILPKYSLDNFQSKNFIYHSSKVLNYFLKNDISYSDLSPAIFKCRFKRNLMNKQNQLRVRDDSWLPCNLDIFSDIRV